MPDVGRNDGGIIWVVTINSTIFTIVLASFMFYLVWPRRHELFVGQTLWSKLGRGVSTMLSKLEAFVSVSDLEINRVAGEDAVLFLRLQRMFIAFFAMTSVLGLTIILPINITQGTSRSGYQITTVQNIQNSDIVWVHALMAFVFSMAVYALLAQYARVARRSLHATGHDQRGASSASVGKHSVMIKSVPRNFLNDEAMYAFYDSAYRGQVVQASIVPELSELQALQSARASVLDRLDFFSGQLLDEVAMGDDDHDDHWHPAARADAPPSASLQLRTRCLLRWIRRALRPLTAHERVQRLQADLAAIDEKICRLARRPPVGTGVAFVTFRSARTARECIAKEIGAGRGWRPAAAPEPSDVVWENLGVSSHERHLRILVINGLLLVTIFVWTSPVAILSDIQRVTGDETSTIWSRIQQGLRGAVSGATLDLAAAYLPSVFLLAIFWLFLYVLEESARYEGQFTKSRIHRSIMHKSFVYLVLNTLIMPALVMTSLNSLVTRGSDLLDTLGRMFIVNSGALFISYIIQAALLGGSMELSRFGEMVGRSFLLWRAVTPEERAAAVQPWPFEFGRYYAQTLSIFATALAYSTMVPLVNVAALLYFTVRHHVDKYNLLHVRPVDYHGGHAVFATHVTQSITASLLVYQASMAGFFSLKQRLLPAMSLFALLTASGALLVARFDCWRLVGELLGPRALLRRRRLPLEGLFGSEADDGGPFGLVEDEEEAGKGGAQAEAEGDEEAGEREGLLAAHKREQQRQRPAGTPRPPSRPDGPRSPSPSSSPPFAPAALRDGYVHPVVKASRETAGGLPGRPKPLPVPLDPVLFGSLATGGHAGPAAQSSPATPANDPTPIAGSLPNS
eukprot:tig00000655_g2838.t1